MQQGAVSEADAALAVQLTSCFGRMPAVLTVRTLCADILGG